MTLQWLRALMIGAVIAAVFASFGWLAMRQTFVPPAVAAQNEDQRLHDMALRDLKETQDEVAKMKAHGIGMPKGSGQ